MPNFYQTINQGKREPVALQQVAYIHVKCKSDGSSTLLVTEETINDPAVLLIDKPTMTQTIQQWITDENLSPERDRNGDPILQVAVDPQIYLDKSGALRDVSKGIAVVQKIERGFISPKDDQIDLSSITILMSPAEKEIFENKLAVSSQKAVPIPDPLVDPKAVANVAADVAIAADAVSLEKP